MQADVHFEEQFAPKLLQSPRVRCFALRLATPPKFEGPPVLGMDMWLLGICLPAACNATALGASAAELFRSVPLSTVTGNRAHHIDELSGIQVEELVHWSELKINFGIIGPPNAGTSSLHRSLQELGAHFLGGADEMPLPVSWLRSEESWQWRCTAPLLPPAGWAKGLGVLRRREVDDDGEPNGLVAFRNPKIIYSSSCLRNLLLIPGLQIIAVWRDPVDWLWSSLHRSFEGFEDAEEEIARAWSIFAESTKGEDPSTLQPLQEQGGGMLELSTWRLGVPLSLGAAAPSRALWKLHEAVGQERLLVLPFKELISKQLSCFDQLLVFLGLPASAGELLPANVRRRRTRADRRADVALKNETSRLQEFFRSERESAAGLLACAARVADLGQLQFEMRGSGTSWLTLCALCAQDHSVFLGTAESCDEGLDWLGVPEDTNIRGREGQMPVVAASSIGGSRGRGLFTTAPGPPAPVELLRDRSLGVDGFLEDDEAERHCDEKSPESEFMVCMVFGGKFGYLRDEYTPGELWGTLRPLHETLRQWLEEGRCSQHITWDEDEQCYALSEPYKSYVAWNDPSNLAAMANDALYGCCKDQAEYNVKDADRNNLVMVPCARPAEDGVRVEFKSMFLYPRKSWCWSVPQELTLGYGFEEPDQEEPADGR
ncbi:unnamed protein product [Symbiodinium sp. CCMP2456]|nr:unnamed protein product [Symbiodinium sp. CCMP2456]